MFQVSISDQTQRNLQDCYFRLATRQSVWNNSIYHFHDFESETMSVKSLSSTSSSSSKAKDDGSDTSLPSVCAEEVSPSVSKSSSKSKIRRAKPCSILKYMNERDISPTSYDVNFHVCRFVCGRVVEDSLLENDSAFVKAALNVAVRVEKSRCLRFCSVAGRRTRFGVKDEYVPRPHDIRLRRTYRNSKKSLKITSCLSLENVRSVLEQLTDWLGFNECIVPSVTQNPNHEDTAAAAEPEEIDDELDDMCFNDETQQDIVAVGAATYYVSFLDDLDVCVKDIIDYLLDRSVVVDGSGKLELLSKNSCAADYHAGMSFFSISTHFLLLESLVLRSDQDAKRVEDLLNRAVKRDVVDKKSTRKVFLRIMQSEVDRLHACSNFFTDLNLN